MRAPLLVVAALLASCGPDAGGGGGGPPSVVGQISGSCRSFTACGGNLVGTWWYTSACVAHVFPELVAYCPSATVSGASGTWRGKLIITATQANESGTITTKGTASIPSSCVSSCSSVGSLLGSFYSGTCTAVSGGCNCTLTRTQSGSTDPASYDVSGGHVTVHDSNGQRDYDYCVTGTKAIFKTASLPAFPGTFEVDKH
jgi:hypothetical protein